MHTRFLLCWLQRTPCAFGFRPGDTAELQLCSQDFHQLVIDTFSLKSEPFRAVLIQYFRCDANVSTPRKLDHLVVLLEQAGEHAALLDCICQWDMFACMMQQVGSDELLRVCRSCGGAKAALDLLSEAATHTTPTTLAAASQAAKRHHLVGRFASMAGLYDAARTHLTASVRCPLTWTMGSHRMN